MPASTGCSAPFSSSSFQPICGTFSVLSDGVSATTSPGIQPSPWLVSNSRPRSAISCMPTQMPRNGLPPWITCASSASIMPGTAVRPRLQSAKAPTPGSTIWLAVASTAASAVTVTSASMPLSRADRSKALAAERRLPEP